MIYIATALYSEAQPFIDKLNLKKDNEITKFQVFKNKNYTLIITGVGKIPSAIAVTYLLSKSNIGKDDFFINIGLCGCRDKMVSIGSTFICNKIVDNDTGFSYFPDILFEHPFSEGSITTYSKVVKGCKSNELLADMEASALFQAAGVFFQPHQIMFFKIVSDYLTGEFIPNDIVYKYISNNADKIIEFVDRLNNKFKLNPLWTEEEKNILHKTSESLKLSVTMENELTQLLTYYKLKNGDIFNLLAPYLKVECKSKKEGKIYLEQIKQSIV
ncbi:nucleoside phosphorylase [Fervidicella metallireducens AeB]|uniref:Nucleoside phosphorylase n=1 Tax=Fervidicella metallireducens AeB TaxID=1403537 RepID=A0A017RXN8_9CLOT|nr:hypothetical protein [Fervidicella metallireducens]EYE89351.1 nucleoside phosphorylase [Fervidicella metallireducens AeB]